MKAETGGHDNREEFLFHNLIAMLATLAFQQLGKLVNPLSGAVERDLAQAHITIDMLEMISDKTAGNLSGEERRHLDAVLTELRMNYVDESSRGSEEPPDGGEEQRGSGADRGGAERDGSTPDGA